MPLGAGLHPAAGHAAVLGGNRGSNVAKPQAAYRSTAPALLHCLMPGQKRSSPLFAAPQGHVALNLVLNTGEHQALRGRDES